MHTYFTYVYKYICMYILYVCVNLCIYTYIAYIYTHTHIDIHTHTHIYIYIYIHTHTFLHITSIVYIKQFLPILFEAVWKIVFAWRKFWQFLPSWRCWFWYHVARQPDLSQLHLSVTRGWLNPVNRKHLRQQKLHKDHTQSLKILSKYQW